MGISLVTGFRFRSIVNLIPNQGLLPGITGPAALCTFAHLTYRGASRFRTRPVRGKGRAHLVVSVQVSSAIFFPPAPADAGATERRSTRITDRSLEILGRMDSPESGELWEIAGITDAGIAALAKLPNLREISVEDAPNVTRRGLSLFSPRVRVRY